MQYFKSIQINNYRGIKHLSLENFADVNIFLGKNNIGKSTVLESLFMITGMSNPENPQKVNSLRNRLFNTSMDDVKYIFHNMNIDDPPLFNSELCDGSKRKLEILLKKFDFLAEISQTRLTSELENYYNGVEMIFSNSNGETKSFTSARFITKNGFQNQVSTGYEEVLSALYLPANLYDQNIVNDISNIVKNNKKHILLDMLKEFDNRIVSIESLPEGVFIGYENIDGMIPITMLGDGLRRYLCIVAAIANQNNKILFLDEIDNGIHYSSYNDLWVKIFALSKAFQKQIFITTHSREVLFSLYSALNQFQDYVNMLSIYTLEKTDKGENKAYRYSFDGLKQAINNNIEIRSLL